MSHASIYAATKAGLVSLARTLSGELPSRGIRVNAVSPGPTRTPIFEKLALSAADLEAMVAPIPAGRLGNPREIAQAVAFLASDEAPLQSGASSLSMAG